MSPDDVENNHWRNYGGDLLFANKLLTVHQITEMMSQRNRRKGICTIRGVFNKFPAFFLVKAFKIVVDSWKFSMLLLYILWDDGSIFMFSGFNEHVQ